MYKYYVSYTAQANQDIEKLGIYSIKSLSEGFVMDIECKITEELINHIKSSLEKKYKNGLKEQGKVPEDFIEWQITIMGIIKLEE